MITKTKTLDELNLIDSFLFSSSTENIQDAEFIAKLIIKRATGHTLDKITIHPEKQFKGLNITKRGIGEDFNNLPDFISIWILSYDPFGENRMIYHIENMVVENPNICYNDGTARIYLYTGGELGGSKELKTLLKFFQDSRICNATDYELKKLYEIVNRIKNEEKVGEDYMIFKEDLDYEREDAHAAGLAEGLEQGLEQGHIQGLTDGIISSYRKFNASDNQIISALMEKCNITEDEAREKLACCN